MTKTGWAYLNFRRHHPLCAWNIYRGAFRSRPDVPGFVSVWAGRLLGGDAVRRDNEFALEAFRAVLYPGKVSRLHGAYCFLNLTDAMRAGHEWGPSFAEEYLTELDLSEAETPRDQLDANWISNAVPDDSGHWDPVWFPEYWAGNPYPGKEPLWETLINGRVVIQNNALRERAYTTLVKCFPKCKGMIELSRSAAHIGSDLGMISGLPLTIDGKVMIDFAIDMRDALDPQFVSKLSVFWQDPTFQNSERAVAALANVDDLPTPDLRPFRIDVPADLFATTGAG